MRYRVDYSYGYASFDSKDMDKAMDFYENHGGIRIRLCEDLFDEGRVIVGLPIVIDWTKDEEKKEPQD